MPQSREFKFLADESVEYRIVLYLRNAGFNISSVAEDTPSILDQTVLSTAFKEKRVLITNDLDFGYLVFSEKLKSWGVILMRLGWLTTEKKTQKLFKVLKTNKKNLSTLFTVIQEKRIKSTALPDVTQA